MRVEVTETGMKFHIDDEPIPDSVAVEAVKAIAAKQREGLENAIRPSNAAATVDSRAQATDEQPAAA